MDEFRKVSSNEEFKDLAQKFAHVVDRALAEFEPADHDMGQTVSFMPWLVSVVNGSEYLKKWYMKLCDDGVLERSSEMNAMLYGYEDSFDHRIQAIIDRINASPKHAEEYRHLMKEFFLTHRGVKGA
jgi:hypothetical protein